MTSENSGDGSVVVSAESSYKCDTISPESVEIQISSAKPSPRKSPRMSAAFGAYFSKAISKGSRAFYGTDSEASDDESVCEAELIGKAAHALSEDINNRIRLRAGSCSPTAGSEEPVADDTEVSKNAAGKENPDIEPSSTVKVDQASNPPPESEERSAQTITSEEESKFENKKSPAVADNATQSLNTAPPAETSVKAEDSTAGRPAADADLLKDREKQLVERVRLLKERKSSARKASSNLGGSFVEQLKKIDLSIDGGTLKICDRDLSENALAAILNAAKNNDKLTELDLSGCNIQKGDNLASLIQDAPKLQRLLLAWNHLGSARTGVAALAASIASTPSLQEVDLRSNGIGPATAAALALALRTNTTLKRLDLMWNDIGPSGATAMIGLLEKNHSLIELKLAGNNIPCQLLEQIDSLLRENRASQSTLEDCVDTPSHRAVTCRGGGTRESKLTKVPTECDMQSQHRVSNCVEADTRCSSGSQTGQGSKKTIQDELHMIRDNFVGVKAELDELCKEKAEATRQLEESRAELCEEIKRREQVECDLEEVRLEFCKLSQETNNLQEKLQANCCESGDKIAALESQVMYRQECERASQERETEANKQIQHLNDQLALLREDSDKRIQAIEAKSKSEAEYNAGLVQKLECSISQREQKHLEEVEALRSQLTAEIDSLKSTKDNLMMEIEKQKSNTKLAEQQLVNQQRVLQQEKEDLELELKRQISMKVVEIECLQNHLEEKDKEHVKIKQKHEECVQGLENDLRKERASVTRAELSKSNAEQKVVAMEAEREQLREKYKAEQERAISLEEKNRADELKHISCMTNLSSKQSEEQEKMKGSLLIQRKQIEAMNIQLKEMQAEHERRTKDVEIQLRGAETAVVEWIQQQFSALQAALSFHATVPAIEYGTTLNSQITTNTVMEELSDADGGQLQTGRMVNSATPPQSPKSSRTSQILAKRSSTVTPRGTPRVSQSVAKTPSAMSQRASTNCPSMAAEILPPLRNSRTSRSIADMRHTCVTPSLSVASLVQPVHDEDVGTVEEDLVSSEESIDTDEFCSAD